MAKLTAAYLPNRGVIRVSGADAKKLLQGIITNDMDLLGGEARALHAGLLTPQGKILFDFFVIADGGDGYLIETDKSSVAGLVQRLNMYKLRADASVLDVSADYTVAVAWGEGSDVVPARARGVAFPDPRCAALGARFVMGLSSDGELVELGAEAGSEQAYDAHRIGIGIPSAGRDFELGDTFPHEALYDQLHGVSFTKGCYVGQEVVSRMQHRRTARKRVVPVVAEDRLPESGSQVMAGETGIGMLGSTSGARGLALLRLDRAAAALERGDTLLAGAAPVRIEIPEWAGFGLPNDGGSPPDGSAA